RIRRPWRLVERWAVAAGGGSLAAHRRLLRLGGVNDHSLAALRRASEDVRGGVCPHCFATVALDPAAFPSATDLSPLHVSHGRLSGHGFLVDLTRTLSAPHLRIETPHGILFDGPEPRGAAGHRSPPPAYPLRRLVVAPLVVLAFVLAATSAPIWAAPVALLTLLVALWLNIALRRNEPDGRPDRVVDHAWTLVVPQLRDGDGEFLAALAETSHRYGDPAIRDRPLRAAIKKSLTRPIPLIAL